MSITTKKPDLQNGRVRSLATRLVRLVDGDSPSSTGSAHGLRRTFPNRWSLLFGHIASFSFLLIIVSGVFLTLWFEPSMATVTYRGDYLPLRGVEMSEAYASTLELSFEVRGGLLMRQIHNWATLVFVAALSAHMLRIFFTGAFRRPWRLAWLIVLGLLVLGMVAAYTGNALPDDQLTGTGLRVTEGVILAVPVIGTYLSSFLFGGEFPGDDIIARLTFVHALVLPVLMVALFAVGVAHARRRQPALRTAGGDIGKAAHEPNVAVASGLDRTVRAGGLMLIVFGVIVLMAATIQINPVWLWGPFDAAQATAGSQPPWYFGFLDGGLRLMPPWDVDLFGHELTLSVLVPAMVMPGLMLTALAVYPWIEQRATGVRPDDHTLDRPRNMPVRTGLGVAFIVFYLVLWIAGGNDILATVLQVPLNWITRFLQVSLIVMPPLAFWITKRICLGLQLRDRDMVLHGRESGVIVASSNGAFSELRTQLSALDAELLTSHPQRMPFDPGPPADANGVPNPNYRADRRRARISRFYFADVVQTYASGQDHHREGHHARQHEDRQREEERQRG
ncbi:ubiquinol-cytochrome c reductase cytochrome b subunit [Haloactinopolyspora alba]|uniref:Cytochrome bc1 complex cytochrome b subunit n=1 Tax=Haloactinopolyspora alba TaxID=648780 RepID=A0A2P8DY15_9ACTN|nr:cytochrome b N-terminal domain-containing protein [Haloactinopolyspora alba]PSL02094.1 ubiquinol-cytochrome c reductase cytochrome b subunit [Haloactinopolyspora alba]